MASNALIYLFQILHFIIEAYTWVIILSVLISWLYGFGVLNMNNKLVYKVSMIINKLADFVFVPVRAVLPTIGGLDLSPIVVLFAIQGIKFALSKLFIALI